MAATKQDEAELVFNRANVALARSQRLISSWLPPQATDSLAQKRSEELDREEDEIFAPVPEKLGLGAPIPQNKADGEGDRSELGSNDKLRKHLLGNKKQKSSSKPPSTHVPQIKENTFQKTGNSDTETEEESRSTLGKRKRKDVVAASRPPNANSEPRETEGTIGTRQIRTGGKGTSYLDELLSKRSSKKRGKDKT